MENPRLIVEQNIRELNDQVPVMNENIARVKANVIMQRKAEVRSRKEVENLTARVKRAILNGREDLAQQNAIRLRTAKEGLEKDRELLRVGEAAYEKAKQVKKAFMRERQRKIDEAREALRAHERAKLQAKVADALEQFEVGGIDQTHDEMINRLDEQTARDEARVEVALDSVDVEALRLEEDAEDMQAAELVRQVKIEMGLLDPDPVHVPDRSSETTAQADKTMGRASDRTRT